MKSAIPDKLLVHCTACFMLTVLIGCSGNLNAQREKDDTAAQEQSESSESSSTIASENESTVSSTINEPKPNEAVLDGWPMFRGTTNCVASVKQPLGESIELMWDYFLEEGGFVGSPVIDQDTIYAVDMDGKAIAIDLDMGTRKWIKDLDVFVDASPALIGDRLVFGDLDGMLFCLNKSDGEVAWQLQTESAFATSVNEYNGNVLAITEGGDLLLLSLEGGSEIWKSRIEDRIISSPAIADGHCFLTGCNSQLYVVSLMDGSLANSVTIPAPTGVTAAVVENHAYFSTSGGTIFCYNWKTGEQVWERFDPRGAQEVASCPAVLDDLLVIGGGSNRQLIAVDRNTGEDLWQFAARRMMDSSPIIVGNLAVVGSHDGRAYFVDTEKGEKKFEFECGGVIANAPASANGRVVIANDQGGIFCFGSSE